MMIPTYLYISRQTTAGINTYYMIAEAKSVPTYLDYAVLFLIEHQPIDRHAEIESEYTLQFGNWLSACRVAIIRLINDID